MDNLTTFLVVGALVLVVLDLFIPSGGLLSGLGIAVLIERGLDALGVVGAVRWPLAGVGMLFTVALVIRYGERLSETLFPARIRTNVDRLVGLTGTVIRQAEGGPVVEFEGDLWTCRPVDAHAPPPDGARVEVVALEDQVPVVRVLDAGL